MHNSVPIQAVTAQSSKQLRAWLTTLTIANFVMVTTEFVLIGLLPQLMGDLGISIVRAGSLISVFAFSAALFGPLLTILLRRVERRLLLSGLVGLFGILNLLVFTFPGFWILAIIRIVQGCGLPVFISVASVVAGQLAGARRAGKAVAFLNYAMAAATVFGIPVSALLGKIVGWQAVFGSLGMLALVVVLPMRYTLPRLPPQETPSIAAHLDLLRRPTFLVHLGLSVLTFIGMFAGYSYLGVVLHDLAGLEGWKLSAALLGFGLAGVLGNWFAAQIVDRDPLKASGVNIVIVGATMALTSVAHGGVLQLGAGLLWGVVHMASFVFNQVRMLVAGRSAPTFAAAMHISVCNFGIALGASFGSSLATKFGVRFAGLGGAAIALTAAAIAFALLYARVRGSTGAGSETSAARWPFFQHHI